MTGKGGSGVPLAVHNLTPKKEPNFNILFMHLLYKCIDTLVKMRQTGISHLFILSYQLTPNDCKLKECFAFEVFDRNATVLHCDLKLQ